MNEQDAIVLGKQSFTMIGYLASSSDIIITRDSDLMLKITPRTDYPDSVDFTVLPPQINVFVKNNPGLSFKDDKDLDFQDRLEKAYEAFGDKWFVTTPNFTYNDETGKYYVVAYDVQEIGRNEGVAPEQVKFWRLPIFHPMNTYNRPKNRHEFEDALLKGKVVGNIIPWPADADEAPHGIIWRESADEITLYTGIESQAVHSAGLSFFPKNGKTIQSVHLTLDDNEWFPNFLEFQNSPIGYIPVDIYEKYEHLSEDFSPISLSGDPENEETHIVSDNTSGGPSTNSEPIENTVPSTADALRDMTYKKDQQEKFIHHLMLETERSGLHYALKDLINFHTAMESDGLVILSGLSGTGKSKLVNAYAQALGIVHSGHSSKQLCFVPVRPFWADDSDLLGYADMANNVYRPADSGLVDVLIDASKNQGRMYIVVFDEMNLARVEHYFSQFLSVLEMSPQSRYISLYNPKLASRLYNSESYPAQVQIHNNVLFVGTVNTDESTFQFSDKVLDRSNVISLHILPFNQHYAKVSQSSKPDTDENGDSEITSLIYRNLSSKDLQMPLTDQEKSLLWDLHQALNKQDRNYGIGWRIVAQIDSFVKNLPSFPDGVSREEALDLQIVQRVLTKVRGSEEQLKELLGDDTTTGSLAEVLDKYSGLYKFTASRELLEQKARELKLYGFTM
ncbi:McrB family protein [Lacticaseibacillus mingshuiensis]|uniref:McrB family protein n=1 Tax=Lacticaseibacillus mingshuiensis TaxID=2799574 RepID=A0ABW4CE24_9LACO|nr:hypothetical protein [Lacticaseibacillus mingshuiensis]